MNILSRKLDLILIGLAMTCASTVSAQTLTTPLLGGNENDGVMFDIQTGANALTLTSIGANIIGTASYQIYYKLGTINSSITNPGGGNVSNPGAWTLLGSFSNVVGFGTASAQPGGIVDFNTADLALAANSIYGLYITQTVANAGIGSGVRFTNSVLGSIVASDSNLTIQNSRGATFAFAGISGNGRSFNGSLTYTVNAAVPEPASWGLMIAGLGLAGAALRRRSAVAATA